MVKNRHCSISRSYFLETVQHITLQYKFIGLSTVTKMTLVNIQCSNIDSSLADLKTTACLMMSSSISPNDAR